MGSIGTCFGSESKGNKIEYFSPSIGGFTFGVSFTPTGGARFAGGGLAYGTDVTASGPGNAGNNILSFNFDYVHDFSRWNLEFGGGGEWAFTQYTPAGAATSGDQRPAWYQGCSAGRPRSLLGGVLQRLLPELHPCRLCGDHRRTEERWTATIRSMPGPSASRACTAITTKARAF
jgi:hypothetical protein